MSSSAKITDRARPGLGEMTADHFFPYRGHMLTFLRPASGLAGRERLELELLRVTSYPQGAAGNLRTPFSLIFRSVGGQTLGPGLHTLEHEAFELSDIFLTRILVPAEFMREGGVFYEAVFG